MTGRLKTVQQPDAAAAEAARFNPTATAGGSQGFTPIADYAFLSDCHTGALVGPDGAIDWLSIPRFDSPSVFTALLDRSAGQFRIGPYGVYAPLARRYLPGTNVLETTWVTRRGWLLVRDALVIGPWRDAANDAPHARPPTDQASQHTLLRLIECVQGEIELEVVCEPMFDYAREPAEWELTHDEHGGMAHGRGKHGPAGEEQRIRMSSNLRLGVESSRVRARHTLVEGEKCFVALGWAADLEVPRSVEEADKWMSGTFHYWRSWLTDGDFPDHRWSGHLQRSALALKGLTYAPTGALVAALTTSLPETPGGERNWDYRYTWMRDATFTLYALHALGLDWEADDFMQFVVDLDRNDDGSLQIMYAIGGERDLTERTLDHLRGYDHSRPVRIGNGAYAQRQNDVYGAVVDSVYLHTKRRNHMPADLWPLVQAQVECAATIWQQPDQGIWEARGEPKHYVSSKLMCWVAMDRGARLAEIYGDPELAARWQQVADEIHDEILERGVSDRGVFRQHYDSDALDASLLLMPIVRFLPADDGRLRNTALAIADELTEHGLVLRYKVEETDDGLSGKEGTFAICSFWLVSALSEIGQKARARALCERMLSLASPLGLYGEEIEAETGRHLGNFPQAFTHLALINAVQHVIADELGP
ncbi:MAG: glycoside hydrolase family 15 protein [Actinomycetota bacterium]|nr:glycoside hydrolase family 15 protein [Actinomycetota bacterium]